MIETGKTPDAIANLPIEKRAITNKGFLNEAYSYAKPSSFSRGMRIDFNGLTMLLISGTASIDEHGNSKFRADQEPDANRCDDIQ